MSRIIVGISGGVDSSVAAYLLKKAGHEVIGCRMRTFDTPASLEEERSAAEVAERLGIPLYTIDMRDAFAKNVIAHFAEEYAHGRTPNPCLRCNRLVKWQALLQCMREHDADLVATGHYAAVTKKCSQKGSADPGPVRFGIARVASEKDQSYALYDLTQEEIAHTVFPLSGLTKEEVRELAREAGLLTAEKPDSMEICFIPDNDYAGFLGDRFGIRDCPGSYVDEEGHVLGKHQGIVHYTVGQRKGLGIALGKRIFVKEIRPLTNEVVLADDSDVFTDHIFVKDMNFQLLSPDAAQNAEGVFASLVKIRYADRGTPGTIRAAVGDLPEYSSRISPSEDAGQIFRIDFDRPVRAAAPGQAAVCYNEEGQILCGGIILQTQKMPFRPN